MKKIIALFALLFCLSLPLFSLAQPGGDDDVVDVPIDGGISLLVVAGVSYGAKKLYGRRSVSIDELKQDGTI